MKINAKTLGDALAIARAALAVAPDLSIVNTSGESTCFTVSFDEAGLFTDEELTRVLTAGAYYEVEGAGDGVRTPAVKWTISDYANIGHHWGRNLTLREAYAAASDRSDGSMKIRIDRRNRVVSFRGRVYL